MTLIIGLERHGQTLIAGDTLATSNDGWGQKYRGVNKLIKASDGAIGFCGDYHVYNLVKENSHTGHTIDELIHLTRNIVTKKCSWGALAVTKNGIFEILQKYSFQCDAKVIADGSGRFVGLGVAEALYDSDLSNDKVLERVFAITAKNINTVGKYYTKLVVDE